MGADIVTVPFDVFNKIVHHPLTDEGLEKFSKTGKRYPSK